MTRFLNRRWPEYHNFLPTSDHSPSQDAKGLQGADKRRYSMLPTSLPKRYARLVLASLVTLGFLYSFNGRLFSARQAYIPLESVTYPEVQQTSNSNNLPPLWEAYREYEDAISELEVLNTNGSQRYIYFANHAHACGWGNVLQEMVFASILASEANLGFVWDDYTWNDDGSKYSKFNGKPIPSRTPLSTMISGHLLGLGPAKDNANEKPLPPRSISRKVYERICPTSDRVVISKGMVVEYLRASHASYSLDEGSGEQILNAWLSVLETPTFQNARCIEVDKSSDHIFDIWLLGSNRLHDLWDRLSRSPTLEYWRSSPLILGAFAKNIYFFTPEKDIATLSGSYDGVFGKLWNLFGGSKRLRYPPAISQLKEATSSEILANSNFNLSSHNPLFFKDSKPLPILALHLRRGDFQEHCSNLAEWTSSYTGINSFPQFRVRDSFHVPRIGNIADYDAEKLAAAQEIVVASAEEVKQIYASHCFPEVADIVRRVREVMHDYVKFAKEHEQVRKQAWWMWDTTKETRENEEEKWKQETDHAPDKEPNIGTDDEKEDIDVDESLANDLDQRAVFGSRKSENAHRLPTKVFIMTNGDRSWLMEVKRALLNDAARSKTANSPESGWDFEWEWEDVVTSRDLNLGWEEKPVAQMLDSYISQRAEVFIGNGFSSLTSNIVMLRMKKGMDPVQTRFW